jgi:hypothetical protein
MRSVFAFIVLFALCACEHEAPRTFVAINPPKNQTAAQQELAKQFALNRCHAEAMKSIGPSHVPEMTTINSNQTNITIGSGPQPFDAAKNVALYADTLGNAGGAAGRAQRNRELQSAVFTSCMNEAGYLQQ